MNIITQVGKVLVKHLTIGLQLGIVSLWFLIQKRRKEQYLNFKLLVAGWNVARKLNFEFDERMKSCFLIFCILLETISSENSHQDVSDKNKVSLH